MSLRIVQCRTCGHQTYPARLWCPVCAEDHGQAAEVAAQEAELIAWTVMPQREPARQIEPSPQSLAPSPQALEPSRQALEPSRQALEPSRQALEPSRQALERSPQALEPSPQALEPSPQVLEPSGRPAGEAIIATVRVLPNGPVLVLRLDEAPTRPGQRLRLFERIVQGQALPWARALTD